MSPDTRTASSFRFRSHGQRLLLAVGFSLPTSHDHRKLRGDRGYQCWDIKATALAQSASNKQPQTEEGIPSIWLFTRSLTPMLMLGVVLTS